MSWHFSRALVEAFLVATCSDGEPSAPSSGSPTPQVYCSPDRMTAFSRLSRFGMTCSPLTDDRGEALLTWYRAGFRAKTSALPERVQALTASGPACGRTWHGSLATFDRASSSWRTVQQSLLGDSDECSVTWPRSGMTADGRCWELPMLGRRTSVTGSGLWPTPVASDTSSRSKPYAQGGTPLSLAVKWPTPTVCGNYNRKGASATSGDGLATAVRMWPTPNAQERDGKQTPGSHLTLTKAVKGWKKGRVGGSPDSVVPDTEIQDGGPLNPTWVEWLMGWPLGWTDLKPLEMGKYQQWRQQHGGCSVSPESPALQDAETTA